MSMVIIVGFEALSDLLAAGGEPNGPYGAAGTLKTSKGLLGMLRTLQHDTLQVVTLLARLR